MGRSSRRLGAVGSVSAPRVETARAWAERTCREQGVTVKVTDSQVVGRVAGLIEVRLGQSRQSGVTRDGSNAVRPRTAGATVARSRSVDTIACCRARGNSVQRSRRAAESPT